MGCATPEGATGANIARIIAYRAGCPATVPGTTVNRFCSSGLQTIALAAQRIMCGRGGHLRRGRRGEHLHRASRTATSTWLRDTWTAEHKPDLYLPMLETAENVAQPLRHLARAHGRVRRAQPDRACAAHAAGQFRRRDRRDAGHDGRRRRRRPLRDARRGGGARRRAARRHHLRGRVEDPSGAAGWHHGRGQCQPVLRRRGRVRRHERARGRAPQPDAARHVPRLRDRRLRARRNGHRPGVRRAQTTEARRAQGARHRALGAQRGVRRAGALLPRHGSALPTTGSMSMAARSPSAIRSA